MRKGSIRPPYPRLFDPRRRPAQNRASSRFGGVVVIPEDEEPTEDQLADRYESWNLYTVESPIVQTLNKGFGWTGNWVEKADEWELATDDMESYAAEDPVSSTLNGGVLFSSAWVITNAA